jgi:hypothetical protein
MSIRFLLIFLSFFFLLKQSFSRDPYIKIIQRFEENDPILSSAMKVFLQDVTDDSTREIIVQNNYKFAVFQVDIKGETLIPGQRFTLSPIELGKGPYYFCFGCLEPDTKDALFIMTPEALFRKDPGVQGEDLPTTPEKIMEYNRRYPQDDQATQISHVQFAVDIEGDGYNELILPEENGFSLHKKYGNEIREIPIPQGEIHRRTQFNADISYVNYRCMINQQMDLISFGDGKAKSLVYYPKDPGDKEKSVIHIYRPHTPLSFSKEPDQEIIIEKEPILRIESFSLISDFDKDGFMDVIFGESNYDMFSPLTILKFYKAFPQKTSILERPDQQIRLRDSNGIFFFDDFSGDGFTDFCLLQFDYNASSTDDVVEFFVNNYTRYRLNFHYYDPEISGYSSISKVSLPIRIKRSVYPYMRARRSISLDGDFNGDGLKDIMAIVSPDRGEIYIQNPGGIDKKPYATFDAYNALFFYIDDIDRGGRDDLVLISLKNKILSLYLFR